jgi:hypothetical protein
MRMLRAEKDVIVGPLIERMRVHGRSPKAQRSISAF